MSLLPFERIQRIIDAENPRKVVFKTQKQTNDSITLEAITIVERKTTPIPEDRELQAILVTFINEYWEDRLNKHTITCHVHDIWRQIKNTIASEYEKFSCKSPATKRKTEVFLSDIAINDKYLPEYLIQMFIKIFSSTYKNMSDFERSIFFNPLEALRRTYGKRK